MIAQVDGAFDESFLKWLEARHVVEMHRFVLEVAVVVS